MCISCFINIFSEYYVNFLCFVWYDTSSFTLLLLVAQTVRHLPAMWETWIRSPGWEDPLEKEMATHSSILPGESHGLRSLVGYSPQGRKELDTTELLHSPVCFHYLN